LSVGARGTPVGAGRSAGAGRLLAGVFSSNGGVSPVGFCLAASLLSGGGAPFGFWGAMGVSTLPRMTGKPSLPLPMITILVFGDCAS